MPLPPLIGLRIILAVVCYSFSNPHMWVSFAKTSSARGTDARSNERSALSWPKERRSLMRGGTALGQLWPALRVGGNYRAGRLSTRCEKYPCCTDLRPGQRRCRRILCRSPYSRSTASAQRRCAPVLPASRCVSQRPTKRSLPYFAPRSPERRDGWVPNG